MSELRRALTGFAIVGGFAAAIAYFHEPSDALEVSVDKEGCNDTGTYAARSLRKQECVGNTYSDATVEATGGFVDSIPGIEYLIRKK